MAVINLVSSRYQLLNDEYIDHTFKFPVAGKIGL
jgi:hypothetical protein